jgi:hypothetical protein
MKVPAVDNERDQKNGEKSTMTLLRIWRINYAVVSVKTGVRGCPAARSSRVAGNVGKTP